ncbi:MULTISPECIES: hypothetical protein [Streptomyces]|uniref:hypothetical protein n=1 Tax=Streptomyces TaxID=1883 RepID=UPI00225A685F|nr:hypothetical protein [Streptomyces sp. NBC_00160]MCX5307966.1 hypothetical protein [Streptomyces sp. NBC_00160]
MARRGRMEADRGATSAAPAVPGSAIAEAADGGSAARGWLRLGRDGRLTAYASCAEGLVRWTESAPGSDIWQGPELFPVEGWAGRFTLAQDHNGFVWFAGTRFRDGAPGGRELIVATQYQTGRPLGDWRAVGNPFPERKKSQPQAQAQPPGQQQPEPEAESGAPLPPPGDPVVLPDGTGALHILTTRFGVGARGRTRRADGVWGSWVDYQGKWVRGAVVPLVTAQGRAEFLVTFRGGASYWGQEMPGSDFRWLGRMKADAVEGTYSSCETGPGIGTYFWRHPADGGVIAYRPQAPAGASPALMPLGGAGGVGPVGVARTRIDGYDCTVLLQRGAEGYPEIAAYPTHGEHYGTWWAPVGDRCAGLPAISLDARGSVTIAMIDLDGGLLIARQDPTDPGLAFGPWCRVG